MNEEEFWRCISLVGRNADRGDLDDKSIDRLIRHLSECSISDIEAFVDQLSEYLYALDTRAHYVASILHDEFFLGARCYVVAQGKDFYYDVLQHPRKMVTRTFRQLLSAPSKAWAVKTGQREADWGHRPRKACATYSNRNCWKHNPNTVACIEFKDTYPLVEAIVAADSSVRASIGTAHLHIGRQFASALVDLDFATPGYRDVLINLSPFLDHGTVKHRPGESNTLAVEFDAGVRAGRYVRFSALQRSTLFVNLIFSALEWLSERDKLDAEKIQQAYRTVLSEQ